jgi:predicted RNA-binding Zn-ribbon protein involved in translation (DUF1610 family)
MAIRFNCPKCGSLIAFADKHAGKTAKCLSCGQQLVIPEKSNQTPRVIEPKEEPQLPLPGFYHAVFVESWKIFFDRDNFKTIVFVIAAVCFKFFSAGLPCLAFVVYFAAWGYLFGFYLMIIYETAVGSDKFPEIEVGTGITFLWYIIKPLFLFVITLLIVELPCYIVLWIAGRDDSTLESMWHFQNLADFLLVPLFVGGLFVFPVGILTVAMMNDLVELFRLKSFLVPIIKAFWPYLTVVAILAAACLIEANAKQYAPTAKEPALLIAGKLAVNLAGQAVAIISMRTIGLFYRHYECFFDY